MNPLIVLTSQQALPGALLKGLTGDRQVLEKKQGVLDATVRQIVWRYESVGRGPHCEQHLRHGSLPCGSPRDNTPVYEWTKLLNIALFRKQVQGDHSRQYPLQQQSALIYMTFGHAAVSTRTVGRRVALTQLRRQSAQAVDLVHEPCAFPVYSPELVLRQQLYSLAQHLSHLHGDYIMSVKNQIVARLTEAFSPHHLLVENESHKHRVPPDAESHFKVVVVSDCFTDASPVDRHRQVYRLLSKELSEGVHALALHMYTRKEWQETDRELVSPDCRGAQG